MVREHQIVVDLTDLTFLDRAGLGALIRLASDVEQRGGTVSLMGVSGAVARFLELAGVDPGAFGGAAAWGSGTDPMVESPVQAR